MTDPTTPPPDPDRAIPDPAHEDRAHEDRAPADRAPGDRGPGDRAHQDRPHQAHEDHPGRSAAEIAALVDGQLSRADRLRYVALAILGATAAALIGTLWLTEPSLPLRTHLAFGAMCIVGLAWVTVSVVILTRRRPLYGSDRVLASGVAVLASAVVGLGAVVVAVQRGRGADVLAVGLVAGTTLSLAVVVHLRARRRRRQLLARRRQLEAAGRSRA